MSRFLVALAGLTLAGWASAQTPPSVGFPPPLAYAQDLVPLAGKTLYLRHVVCNAPGRETLQGRLYIEKQGSQLQVARVEYNEAAKYMLDNAKTGKGYTYFDKYVSQRQSFNYYIFTNLLGLWKVFGTKINFQGVDYRCELS